MYADEITPSMKKAITETERRRKIQSKYNEEHGIVPKTIVKKVSEILEISNKDTGSRNYKKLSTKEKDRIIRELTKEMKLAAQMLEFEHAAFLRDEIKKLKN